MYFYLVSFVNEVRVTLSFRRKKSTLNIEILLRCLMFVQTKFQNILVNLNLCVINLNSFLNFCDFKSVNVPLSFSAYFIVVTEI